MKDYTLSLYAPDKFTIYNSLNKTQFDTPVTNLTDTLKTALTAASKNLTLYEASINSWITEYSGFYHSTSMYF